MCRRITLICCKLKPVSRFLIILLYTMTKSVEVTNIKLGILTLPLKNVLLS